MQLQSAKSNLGYISAFKSDNFSDIGRYILAELKAKAPNKPNSNSWLFSSKSAEVETLTKNPSSPLLEIAYFRAMNDIFSGRQSTDGKEIITGDTVEGDDKPQTPDENTALISIEKINADERIRFMPEYKRLLSFTGATGSR